MKINWPIKIIKVKDKKAERLLKDFYKTFIGGYASSIDVRKSTTKNIVYKHTVFVLDQQVEYEENSKAAKILEEMFELVHYPKGRKAKKTFLQKLFRR